MVPQCPLAPPSPPQPTFEGLLKAQTCSFLSFNLAWVPSALGTKFDCLHLPAVLLTAGSSACQHLLILLQGNLFPLLHSCFRTQPQIPLLPEALPDAQAGSSCPPQNFPHPNPAHSDLSLSGGESVPPPTPLDCEALREQGQAVAVTAVSPAPRAGAQEMNGC